MNRLVCNRPGCVSLVAYEGAAYCPVHGSELKGAKWCELCHGQGWHARHMPCAKCGGTGLLDKTTHVPPAGRDRRKTRVDQRGLIRLSEEE